jgi:hypothetical protein
VILSFLNYLLLNIFQIFLTRNWIHVSKCKSEIIISFLFGGRQYWRFELKEMPYLLSHTSCPFCFGYFSDRISYFLPRLASDCDPLNLHFCTSGITDVCYHYFFRNFQWLVILKFKTKLLRFTTWSVLCLVYLCQPPSSSPLSRHCHLFKTQSRISPTRNINV